MIEQWSKEIVLQRLLAFILLAVLVILCLQVVRFFISPAIWAAILAYVTFPLYQFFHQKVRLSPTLSALIMTVSITLIIGIPLAIGVIYLQHEVVNFYSMAVRRLQAGYVDLPENIKNLPVIGQQIKDILWEINKDPESSMAAVRNWIQSHLHYGKIAFDAALKNFAKLGMALMTVFFFYRDGLSLVKQIRQAMRNIIGDRIDHYINAIASTTQAVVYGIGLTALAQALLAGIGYAVAGAPSPILLTLITFVVAMIPFGTPFAWGAVSLWLLSQGFTTQGIGLAVWGILVISWVDNLIRPIVISGATKIPFIIIFIGVLGGLTAFGFVGLFIGPVVLAIALAVWREWISQHKSEIFASRRSGFVVADGEALLADTDPAPILDHDAITKNNPEQPQDKS
ncbi:Predicted PurR-regulated permease PerM [Moraxella cuniculi DSM 21768]|uniref:Predicted PurR-regulated permease PerM n=2 Tax=Moraxella cuniculi TaxID=34061 RepID=A0A1N7D6I3_9GAMM|nr:AI-2E family transporter [Moraxella cuniculi]OOS07863.1 AI-2E family transporter [Moraxella cuniculi]SIR71486.1 Predicted PurR-regulated permease PerM [Moraxella cuniculi DSM 21768]VEG12968.1 putative inner membrane protein [Moraxella cuniculi]